MNKIHTGDCLEIMRIMADDSVDLVFCSPPYDNTEDTQEGDYVHGLTGDEWVGWALERYVECLRVCRGLVVWLVDGLYDVYHPWEWSASPIMLTADICRLGYKRYKPRIHCLDNQTGHGGPLSRLRSEYEFAIMSSKEHMPLKWTPESTNLLRRCETCHSELYDEDLSDCPSASPLWITKAFVWSFCPEGGTVLDPFCGTGTTLLVAEASNRRHIGIDIDPERVKMSERRLRVAEQLALAGARPAAAMKGCGERITR